MICGRGCNNRIFHNDSYNNSAIYYTTKDRLKKVTKNVKKVLQSNTTGDIIKSSRGNKIKNMEGIGMTIKERIERNRKLEELVNKYESATSVWVKVSIADLIVAELKRK